MGVSGVIGLLEEGKVHYCYIREKMSIEEAGALLHIAYKDKNDIEKLVQNKAYWLIGNPVNGIFLPEKYNGIQIDIRVLVNSHLWCSSSVKNDKGAEKGKYRAVDIKNFREIIKPLKADFVYLYNIKNNCWFIVDAQSKDKKWTLSSLFQDEKVFAEIKQRYNLSVDFIQLRQLYMQKKKALKDEKAGIAVMQRVIQLMLSDIGYNDADLYNIRYNKGNFALYRGETNIITRLKMQPFLWKLASYMQFLSDSKP